MQTFSNPTAAGAARTGKVIEFDQAARVKQVVDERAVKVAFDKFHELIANHGCRRVALTAYTPDGHIIIVNSHDTSSGLPELELIVEKRR